MKYLNKFYTYLKESNNLDIDYLKDSLLYLQDIIASVSVNEESVFFKNEYRKSFVVNINITDLKKEVIVQNSYERTIISDNRYWEILNELINIKNRLINDSFYIIFEPFPQSISGKTEINKLNMHIILNELSQDLLGEYYIKLNAKLNSMKSDFSYNTTISYYDKKIVLKSDGYYYTTRKFNNLLTRIVDKNKININTNPTSRMVSGRNLVYNTIKLN